MIGIVIPAHDEESCLADCLRAVQLAAAHPGLHGEAVIIVVVLDSCKDGSAQIAQRQGIVALTITARNVGQARAIGANYLIEAGVRWLAFTDADTQVSPEWLAAQLSLGADAVCGSIAIGDWHEHTQEIRARFEAHYRDVDGHRHIHGANLGMTREAYIGAGGFPPLTVSEDVALVEALSAGGWRIAWSSAPRVMTSARSHARANGGFASFLMALYGNGTVPIDGSDTEATISRIDPRALDVDIPITFQA